MQKTVHTIAELRARIAAWKQAGERVAFVPTMGNLHRGHIHLVERARELAPRTVASIFVNPMQFGANEDYAGYPRTLEDDSRQLEAVGLDLLFAPKLTEVYPRPLADMAQVTVPELSAVLCGVSRPIHFSGVTTVVTKLFNMVQPDVAVFGEKDWQQLKLIEAMVARAKVAEPARWPELRILPHATVRERDGLAMSSRNRYLTPELREQSLGIARALQVAHSAQRPATAEKLMRETLELHGFSLDYAVVRDADTLLPVGDFARPTRALIAARIGSAEAPVRLIDNAAMTVWS